MQFWYFFGEFLRKYCVKLKRFINFVAELTKSLQITQSYMKTIVNKLKI